MRSHSQRAAPRPRTALLRLALAASLPLCAAAAHADNDGLESLAQKVHQQRCSTSALRGTYGYSVGGVTNALAPLPPLLQGSFAAVGTTVYDGRGKVTISARSASFNGFIQAVPPETGSYTVSSDCIVTASYPSGVTTRNVLIDGGRAMYAIQTNTGTVIGGMSHRIGSEDDQDRRGTLRCTREGLAGNYGFLAEGMAGPPTLPIPAAVPLVGNGTVVLERDGSFKLVALRSAGGVLDPQALTLPGTFTVGSDCGVTMKFDIGFNFKAIVVDEGQEILFVETDPGTTVRVRARRQ